MWQGHGREHGGALLFRTPVALLPARRAAATLPRALAGRAGIGDPTLSVWYTAIFTALPDVSVYELLLSSSRQLHAERRFFFSCLQHPSRLASAWPGMISTGRRYKDRRTIGITSHGTSPPEPAGQRVASATSDRAHSAHDFPTSVSYLTISPSAAFLFSKPA